MRSTSAYIRALREALSIQRSGLMHVAYYRSQLYNELKGDRYLLRLAPALHYVLLGAPVSKNPNWLFDTEYYLDSNPEVARSGQNPLVHFLREGARKRLNPGPFFDTGYYCDRNPAVAESGLNPLVHYFRHGTQQGLCPHPLLETIRCVDQPLAVDQDTGRDWLQRGLGASSAANPKPASRPDRVIRFEWDPGGWNNIRMQAEVLVCLAARYDRALVLPVPDDWYLIPGGSSHLFDYFDEAAFRAAVPVLPADTRLDDEWEVPSRLAVTDTIRLNRAEYIQQQDRESWYFPRTTRMFGGFASVLGSDARDYALVNQAFRLRSDLLDKASQLLEVHGLKPGAFLAAHIRRGDFDQYDMRYLSTAKIVEALHRHGADAVASLLIVSDEYDEELLEACRKRGWEPVCWATNQGEDARFAGVLDMLCCCFAWRFVGTGLSTFSNGIIQWRGHISRVDGTGIDAIPRFTAEIDQFPWWATVDEHAWLSI